MLTLHGLESGGTADELVGPLALVLLGRLGVVHLVAVV